MIENPSFFSTLSTRVESIDSLLCIGLDPHPEFLAHPSAADAREFCLELIEETAEYACAFKPNSAFFELYGPPGWAALGDVIAAVPPDIPVILDAKRGDIASTARLYSKSVFETLGAQSVTLSPYLGQDAIEPFVQDPAHGVFLLCKTSNPGADAVQGTGADDEPLYMRVAELARQWNVNDNIGLVVGATDPEALSAVRTMAPELWILAPGVGPQGGKLETALLAGLRTDGMGFVLPMSRAIASAESPATEAAKGRAAINEVRQRATARSRATSPEVGSHSVLPVESGQEHAISKLPLKLLQAGCVKLGDFKLKSGTRSPIYFDLRLLAGYPELLRQVAAAYLPVLEGLDFERLAAVPLAGIPITTAISLQSGRPMIYTRKEGKGYGTNQRVEGGHEQGETVVLIDDLATDAGSKLEAIDQLHRAGLIVRDVVVLIDREGGAAEALSEKGVRFHSVFALSELVSYWDAAHAVPEDDLDRIRNYLAATTF